MPSLIAAAAVFLSIHLLVSGTRLRDTITAAIGEKTYLALFSIVSLGAIVWLSIAYRGAVRSGGDATIYNLGGGIEDLAIPVVGIAFLLAIPGLLMPNPTSVGQANVVAKQDAVRGVLRVTRHPFLWGVALWSAFHLLANGDQASVILFGSLLVLALTGTRSIDAKRQRKLGPAWTDFAQKTSNLPFAAIFAGRNTLVLREYLDWRFLLALTIFLAVLFTHAWIFGASPFPQGWVPS